jgi:hypothetical protein
MHDMWDHMDTFLPVHKYGKYIKTGTFLLIYHINYLMCIMHFTFLPTRMLRRSLQLSVNAFGSLLFLFMDKNHKFGHVFTSCFCFLRSCSYASLLCAFTFGFSLLVKDSVIYLASLGVRIKISAWYNSRVK